MDKILVLGASGFTGEHLFKYVLENNLNNKFEFVAVDILENNENSENNLKYISMNVSEYSLLESLIVNEKPDYIINLIGIFGAVDLDLSIKTNADISKNICQIIVEHKMEIKKILLVGSAAEYGFNTENPLTEESTCRPMNTYGLSKKIQTDYFQYYVDNYKLNIVIARVFNILGKNISEKLSIGSFMNQINKLQDGESLYVGNIETKRDFLDVEDVIDAYFKILIYGRTGEIYNVCRGESTYIKDIINLMIKYSEKKINVKIKQEYIKANDIMDSFGENSKLKNDTHWEYKLSIEESIKKAFLK